MKISFRATQKIFFTVWYLSLIVIVGYFILVEKKILPSQTETLITLVNINLVAGVLFLSTIVLQIGIYALTEFLSFKLVLALVIIIAGLFFFFRRQRSLGEEIKPVSTSLMIVNAANDVRIFYLALFFETFGYPEDEKMATAEELFDAVNSRRISHGLREIEPNESLCQLARGRVGELYSVVYTTRFEASKKFVPEGGEFKEIGEIDEITARTTLAKNLVERKWSRAFSGQKDLLNDPSWRYGCAVVSGHTIIFLFGSR